MDVMRISIERFLRTGEGDFDSLALHVFAHQFEKNAPYQAFCRAQGRTPANVQRWQEIPAVPIQAFKSAVLSTVADGRAAAVFESSGTTRQTPSRHFMATLDFYHASLKTSFQKWVLPDQVTLPFLILAPSPGEAPHSSLTWMLDVAMRQFGAPESGYYIQRGLLDDWALDRALRNAERLSRPVALFGTTLGFLAFFDRCAQTQKTYRLPADSRMMDTGGMKTEKREVTRRQFLDLAKQYLDVPEGQCINEYSMCELSSQFYTRGADPVLQGPPWVRVEIVEGLVRIFDLANVDSVLAIQTEDKGEKGGKGFVLQGRASGAELKGCSLALEAFLGAR